MSVISLFIAISFNFSGDDDSRCSEEDKSRPIDTLSFLLEELLQGLFPSLNLLSYNESWLSDTSSSQSLPLLGRHSISYNIHVKETLYIEPLKNLVLQIILIRI
jgi:hypothetical protein